tara:strand:+ start:96 stop:593 length:498 start_codon:yes stop_codon:yes gene_type:complete
MKKLLTILLVAIIMQGCATTYQSNGYTGGYSETQLDENVFKVSFRGNGFTRKDRTEDFTLLRSAELAIKNGYNYFVIINGGTDISTSTHTTPTTYNTTASVYGSGNYAYGTARTTQYGGQSYNVSKPSTSNTIVCFKEKPKDVMSYNANFIYKNVRNKYDIQDDL